MKSSQLDAIVGRRYKAAPGAGYNDTQAQAIGCELEMMAEEGVSITPPAFVERARPEAHHLHPLYEWDNDQAAELYRQGQARNIINHLVIVHVAQESEQHEKALYSVVVHEEEERPARREYIHVREVKEDEAYLAQLEAQAWSELRTFAARCESLGFKAFAPVVRFVAQ